MLHGLLQPDLERQIADLERSAPRLPVRVRAIDDELLLPCPQSCAPLKHRLARSLILYGLVNGEVGPETVLVEASSGSTAVSEAYFARMLGLRFVTVVPRTTSQEKIELIEFYGGECHYVDEPMAVYAEAERIAEGCCGHYLNQFAYAERATDWRGNNNIAESVFNQMSLERHPIPTWIVVSAGT